MEPLTWGAVIGLLVKYTPEVVDYVVRKWNAGGPVTIEEWGEVMELANKTPRSQLLDALTRAGIAETDPKAQALIALLPK